MTVPEAPFRAPGPGASALGGQVSPVLVGRDDLLALADRRLTAAAGGRGELLFFAGEAGIGKSRLLREVAIRAAGAGFAVIGAGASPGDAEVAAGLLTEFAAELRRYEYTRAAGERIARRVRDPGDGDPNRQRRLLVAELTDLVEAITACPWPMLVTLEDLHWADDLTLDVLGRLGRRAQTLPLLLIGTYRSDELYPRVPMRAWRTRLLNQRHAEEVRLHRLSRDDTAAMVSAIAGGVLPATVSGAVFERSDGIPLHVEEFLAAAGGATVPDTLADAVLTRAELLGGSARALAGAASVLGRVFDLDLLTAITGESAEAIDDGLRELTDRFFIQPRPGQATYDFRHALIRDALYADLAPHRRRELHARAAETAVAAGLADAFVSDQYERAGRPATAYGYARSGAAEAAALSAHREAVELYRRAERTAPPDIAGADRAALLTALAAELAATDDNAAAAQTYETAYRLRRELGDDVAAAAIVPSLVAVRHLLGASLAERIAELRAAQELISSRTDAAAQQVRAHIHAEAAASYMLDRRLAEAIEDGEVAQSLADDDAPGGGAMRCNIDATLGSVLLFAGRMDEGWRLLEGAIERARRLRFEGQVARAYRMLGSSASVLVEYEMADRWLRAGIAYADRVERFNDRHYMTAHLGHVRWATGDWDGALAEARSALADGRGGITTRITALHVIGYVHLGRGAFPDAVEALGEAASLGERMNELQRMSPAWWGLAEVALRQGDPVAALGWCERGFAASARVRDASYLFPYVVTGTRAHLAGQDPTGAHAWLDRTATLLRDRNIPGTLAAIDHAAGLIHLHEGLTGKARADLERAAAAWSARHRFWEGTEILLDQARCATRSRRPADAAAYSAAAAARLVSVGVTHVPPSGPPSRSGIADWSGVSDRVSPGVPGGSGSSGGGSGRSGVSAGSGRSDGSGGSGFSDVSGGSGSSDVSGRPGGSGGSGSSGVPGVSGLSGLAVSSGAPAGPALSSREIEVARLVATGATNREIAAMLSIAPKTVAAHVEHILAKLGVSRRAQIAAWAATQH